MKQETTKYARLHDILQEEYIQIQYSILARIPIEGYTIKGMVFLFKIHANTVVKDNQFDIGRIFPKNGSFISHIHPRLNRTIVNFPFAEATT